MNIELQRWLQKHVHIVYSPFHEVLMSLHVLHDPKHHTHRLEWAENVKRDLNQGLLKKLMKYGELSNQWLNVLDYLNWEEERTKQPEEMIEGIGQLKDEAFFRLLMGREIKQEENLLGCTWKNEFCHAMYDYYQSIFARELYRIEPWLIRSVHEINDGMANNPIETVNNLHPRIEITPRSIKFYKAQTYQFFYQDLQSITIYPSTFVAPHLLVGVDAPHLSITPHVEIAGFELQESVPEDLLQMLKTLSDETRLLILQRLLYHTYCTAQLVDLMGLAPATISKHLKILERIKLIKSERRGHYVFYSTNKQKLEMLRVDLDQFFDQPLLSEKQ